MQPSKCCYLWRIRGLKGLTPGPYLNALHMTCATTVLTLNCSPSFSHVTNLHTLSAHFVCTPGAWCAPPASCPDIKRQCGLYIDIHGAPAGIPRVPCPVPRLLQNVAACPPDGNVPLPWTSGLLAGCSGGTGDQGTHLACPRPAAQLLTRNSSTSVAAWSCCSQTWQASALSVPGRRLCSHHIMLTPSQKLHFVSVMPECRISVSGMRGRAVHVW